MNVFDFIGATVEAFSYKFRPGNETDFADSLGGSWYDWIDFKYTLLINSHKRYVSPTAHGIEFLTVVPFYLIMTAYFGYKAVIEE